MLFSTLYYLLRTRPVSLLTQSSTSVWSLYHTLLDWSYISRSCHQFLGAQWLLLYQVIDFDQFRLWDVLVVFLVAFLLLFLIWLYVLY